METELNFTLTANAHGEWAIFDDKGNQVTGKTPSDAFTEYLSLVGF